MAVLPGLLGCTVHSGAAVPQFAFAPGASLSEDADVASGLQQSLSGFLAELRSGELSAATTDPAEREAYAFFYRSLVRGARDAEPVVLKSYPLDGGAHMVTVAFMTGAPDEVAVSRIVEVEARPHGAGYRFRCPYERRTRHLQHRTIGDVVYRFTGPFDEARAREFTRFKTKLEGLQGREPEPLQYDCFESLDDLLKAYGLVFDASKCNFLHKDLGFLWHDGQRYTTGTGDENYLFGYVRGTLANRSDAPDELFGPYVNGVAAYYGGYGLSGDSMEVLARQFREEVERRPTIDFLEEFKKGRKSSIHRHFSYYVMCAFLYQEIAERHGEAAALRPLQSGADGEAFFAYLDELLGVNETNFP